MSRLDPEEFLMGLKSLFAETLRCQALSDTAYAKVSHCMSILLFVQLNIPAKLQLVHLPSICEGIKDELGFLPVQEGAGKTIANKFQHLECWRLEEFWYDDLGDYQTDPVCFTELFGAAVEKTSRPAVIEHYIEHLGVPLYRKANANRRH
jgi:hypothetical protein